MDDVPVISYQAEPPADEHDLRDFLLPDLGEGLEDATIVEWLVAPGDRVDLNQTLCVVETEKATVEVPSPFAGVVVTLGGAENETLRVGELLVRIAVPGSPGPTLVGYGPEAGEARGARRRRRGSTGDPDHPPAKALAPPPVRKLARDLGVDLAALAPGSGAGGVIARADVLAAAEAHGAEPAAHPPAVETRAAALGTQPARAGDTIAVTGVRARIAERMTTSRARIPDATCSVVVDCTRLLEVRSAIVEAARSSGGSPPLTPFVLVCRLLVLAIRDAPVLNATYVDDDASRGPQIQIHSALHLGVGTATERGLLVPVVRNADARSTRDLALEVARVVTAARDGTIAPGDLQGSTFTVSNLGALGLDDGIPVINHPEAAILGVGAIKPRPHVVAGAVAVRSTATLTLAFDHRVADGSEAGRLLTTLRDLVETPELALLDA
jgi:pyruvate dehydrogenase E2 component (dihydrolipoamide acetyltransferase)